MSLPVEKAPLHPAIQAAINVARPLSCYKLRFTNGDYPVLSLLYAVYAGGEHTLYCDHGGPFARAYLVDAVVDAARARGEATVAAVLGQSEHVVTAVRQKVEADVAAARAAAADLAGKVTALVGTLQVRREVMTSRDPADQEAVLPQEAQIDGILSLIKAELMKRDSRVPPLPMW